MHRNITKTLIMGNKKELYHKSMPERLGKDEVYLSKASIQFYKENSLALEQNIGKEFTYIVKVNSNSKNWFSLHMKLVVHYLNGTETQIFPFSQVFNRYIHCLENCIDIFHLMHHMNSLI